jgi:hypothetical protein
MFCDGTFCALVCLAMGPMGPLVMGHCVMGHFVMGRFVMGRFVCESYGIYCTVHIPVLSDSREMIHAVKTD